MAQTGLPLPQSACSTRFGQILEEHPAPTVALQKTQEAEVGGVLLSVAMVGWVDDGVRLLSEARTTGERAGSTFVVSIPAGDYHAVDWSGRFPAKAASFQYEREKSARGGLGKPDVSLYTDRADPTVLKATIDFGLSKRDIVVAGARFERLSCVRVSPRDLRREILYSGGSEGTISLQYREFAGGVARPAFSQDISFDLSLGNEIGFRGARIRVDGISNTGIRYTVLKSME